jgi:hypothetical protein
MLFIIAGFQIKIIKLTSGSNDQFLIVMHYVCVVADLIALFFLIINLKKIISERQVKE